MRLETRATVYSFNLPKLIVEEKAKKQWNFLQRGWVWDFIPLSRKLKVEGSHFSHGSLEPGKMQWKSNLSPFYSNTNRILHIPANTLSAGKLKTWSTDLNCEFWGWCSGVVASGGAAWSDRRSTQYQPVKKCQITHHGTISQVSGLITTTI
jgi:hypothetical protein